MSKAASIAGLIAALLAGGAASATEERGAVTNLPIPRFVSLKAGETNVRRGPSLTHRIDWVYKRRGMPLEVTAEYGHWRRVRDVDGAGGWVHYSLISGVRTVLVEDDMLELHSRPGDNMPVEAKLAVGGDRQAWRLHRRLVRDLRRRLRGLGPQGGALGRGRGRDPRLTAAPVRHGPRPSHRWTCGP